LRAAVNDGRAPPGVRATIEPVTPARGDGRRPGTGPGRSRAPPLGLASRSHRAWGTARRGPALGLGRPGQRPPPAGRGVDHRSRGRGPAGRPPTSDARECT